MCPPFLLPCRITELKLILGSYFPAKAGAKPEEWPLGDESTWKEALKAQTVDGDDSQAVANSIVRHTTTTLGRQAFNMDEVSSLQLLQERC